MKTKRQSIIDIRRREFLSTVGKAGLAPGLLKTSALASGMMLSRAAQSQTGGVDSIINIYVPGGTPFVGGVSQFTPTDIADSLPPASAPLESVKDEITFLSGASVSGGAGHGNTYKAFGAVNGTSYDVKFADAFGSLYPHSLALLGVQTALGNHGYASINGWSELAYQDNPNVAFNTLFNGVDTSGSSASGSGSTDNSRTFSILDVQKEEIAALRSVLGSFEQERLDQHLASLETIESRLNASQQAGSVSSCPIAASFNADGYEFDVNNREHFTTEAELQMDIAVAALSCQLTNNVSIMLGNHQCEFNAANDLSWQDHYHNSIHGGGTAAYTDFIEFRSYLAQLTAYLIQKLKDTPNATGGSMLDSTLVIHSTDMGNGDAHGNANVPVFFAGGGSSVNRGTVIPMGANSGHHAMFDTVTDLFGLNIDYIGGGAISGVLT